MSFSSFFSNLENKMEESDSTDSEITSSSPPESMDVDSKSSETTNDAPEVQIDKSSKEKKPQFQILDVPSHLKLDNRQQFDIVATLTTDNKIIMGTSIIGFRKKFKRPKKNNFYAGMLKYDPAFLEVFSGEPKVQAFKERFPKRKNILVLDKKTDLNAEVFLRTNPKRMGHVIKIEVYVDLYLRSHQKVVTDVLFTSQNHVISVNSACWRSGVSVVLGKRKGRTIDCAYNCTLRDKEGRRVKLMVSMSSSHHKIDVLNPSANLNQPLSPGDEVRVVFVKEGLPIEWLGEEGRLDNTKFIIEEIEISKVAVHWESHPRPSKGRRPCPGTFFSSNLYEALPDELYAIHSTLTDEFSTPFDMWVSGKEQNKNTKQNDNETLNEMSAYIESKITTHKKGEKSAQTNSVSPATSSTSTAEKATLISKTSKLLTSFITPFTKPGSSKEKPLYDLKEKVKEKLQVVQSSKVDKEALAALKKTLDEASMLMHKDFPPFTLKRRIDDYSTNAEWIEVKDLQERSLLFLPQHAVNHNTRVKISGQQHLISLEAYYNSLISDFEKNTQKEVPRLEETDMAIDLIFDSPIIGDVINRRTRATIHWFDGEIQENVSANELGKTKRLHHPTDVQVYRNMLLLKTKPVRPARPFDPEKSMEDKQPKEFGVVTKVSEEKMLTVRWFEKGVEEGAKYEFKGEEVISQYEHIKHYWHRLSLQAIVYFPSGDRDPENVYDCVGHVLSMNDDGTQTIRYLDGGEATFWPEEAVAIDNMYDIYDNFGSFDELMEEDEDESPFSDWEMAEDDVHMITSSSYSSGGSFHGHPPVAAAVMELLPTDYLHHHEHLEIPVIATLPAQPLPKQSSKTSHSAPATPSVSEVPSDQEAPIEPPKPKKVTRRFRFSHGGSLENRFDMSLKRDKKRYDTKEGIALFSAVYMLIEPELASEKMCIWDDSSYSEYLSDYKMILEHPEFRDAYDSVILNYKKNKTDEENTQLATIFERRPNYQERIKDLFTPQSFNYIPKIVELIRDFLMQTVQPPDFAMIRMRSRFKEDAEENCIVIYPVFISKEVKEFLDAQIDNMNENKFEITRPRTLFSYICPANQSLFAIKEGRGMYFCQRSNYIKTTNFDPIIAAYSETFEEDKPLIVAGTIKGVRFFNKTVSAYGRLVDDIPEIESVPENELDGLVVSQIAKADEALYKDGYNHTYAFQKYDFGPGGEKLDEGKKDMIDRLDFGLEEMAQALHIDIKGLNFEFGEKDKDLTPIDNLYCSGELYPNISIPRAILLQISPTLPKANLTDSFLYFQILNQVAESSSWPDVTIKIHKDCGNASSLGNNFVVALILLRNLGVLSSPYFNIAEALRRACELKEQYDFKKGKEFTKYGQAIVQNLRNIALKMGSLSCIHLWRRLNLVEEHFGFERILKSVKEVLAGDSPTVFPLKDLSKITEECKDEHIRKELEAIQISMTPATPRFVAKGTFKTLDNVSSHSFISSPTREMRRDFVATIKKEHKLLREDIAEGVHVITFADRLDLLRAIIIGPLDTPYEGVPLLFDILLGPSYPQEPPKVKYVSMTSQAINPNLYREGTVCLSLLGTWKGENPTMRWIPGTSNILQVVCSIQVEILMEANPYFNEPGFENRRNSEDGKAASRHYNGQVLVGSNEYYAEIMTNPPSDFADFLRDYAQSVPDYLTRMKAALFGTHKLAFPVDINESVRHVVGRYLKRLETAIINMAKIDSPKDKTPEAQLTNLAEIFAIDPATSLTMFSSGNPGSECTDLESFILLRKVV